MASERPTIRDTLDAIHKAGGSAWDDIDDPDAFIRGLRGDYADLESELARLRAIVAKLPKTADGVPVVPGMRIYPKHPLGPEEGVEGEDYCVVRMFGYDKVLDDEIVCDDFGKNYSTREAAEAAKTK